MRTERPTPSSRTTGSVLRRLAALLPLLLAPLAPAQDAIRAAAAFNRQACYIGDSALFEIVVENADEAQPPTLPAIPGADFEFRGVSNESSTSVTIINGRRQERVSRRLVLRWIVTPTRPGTISVPPLSIAVGAGRTIETNEARLHAMVPERATDPVVRVEIDRTRLYVNQTARVRVVWLLQGDIENYSFRASAIDPALEVTPVTIPRQGRDSVYEVDIFGVVTHARLGFDTLKGERVRSFEFELLVTPKYPGWRTLGPLAVSFEERLNVRASRRILAESEPLAIEVLDLPQAGRPAGFRGLLGVHGIEARAEPTSVNVGDPIELTVTITGQEPMSAITEGPDLRAIPGFEDAFRLSPQGWTFTPARRPGERAFTTVIRAANDTVTRIPPIPLHFFDPDSAQYHTAQSRPIPLAVRAVRQVSAADAIVGAPGAAVSREPLAASGAGLWAIDRGAAVLASANALDPLIARDPAVLALLVAPPAFFTAAGIVAFRRGRRIDESERRRRRALASARRALRRHNPPEAVRVYLADAFGLTPAAITGEDGRRVLAGFEESAALAELIAIHEADRYGAGVRDRGAPRAPGITDPAHVLALLRRVDRARGRSS
jgi:hypothetical protein